MRGQRRAMRAEGDQAPRAARSQKIEPPSLSGATHIRPRAAVIEPIVSSDAESSTAAVMTIPSKESRQTAFHDTETCWASASRVHRPSSIALIDSSLITDSAKTLRDNVPFECEPIHI